MIFEDMNLMKLVRPGKRAKANPKVEKAIADLQANGQKVTLKKISELSGVAYMTLYMSGKYAQYVNKHKKVVPAPVVEEQNKPELVFHDKDKQESNSKFCILVVQTNEIHRVHGAEELFAKIKELLLLKDDDYVLEVEVYRLSATARVEITIIDVN
ncbi:hypothetical protein K6L09_21035 [Burkholderia cepacia]